MCVGVYGDQVNEMSWAVGQVLDVIRELRLEENTLALFFSDHGPHLEICEEGGSPGPFRGSQITFIYYFGHLRLIHCIEIPPTDLQHSGVATGRGGGQMGAVEKGQLKSRSSKHNITKHTIDSDTAV